MLLCFAVAHSSWRCHFFGDDSLMLASSILLLHTILRVTTLLITLFIHRVSMDKVCVMLLCWRNSVLLSVLSHWRNDHLPHPVWKDALSWLPGPRFEIHSLTRHMNLLWLDMDLLRLCNNSLYDSLLLSET